MADDNKPPEGGDGNPEGDAAKLRAELEALKATNASNAAELAKLESIRKELEESRQAAKERERKALEEQGQYKTIAEQQKSELDAIKAEAEKAKADALAAQARLAEIENAQREEILATIPEAERGEWKDADLVTLKKVAPLYNNGDKGGSHRGSPKPVHQGPVDFSTMTIAEQMKYAQERNMSAADIARERWKAKQKK